MTIYYHLSPNKLTAEESFAARIQLNGSADLSDIVAKIVSQGTTVRAPDILAVLENAVQAANDYLLLGIRVNFGGLCDLFPKISGKFTSASDGYDPARHRVDVAASPGRRVRAAVRARAAVEKVPNRTPAPVLLEYLDLASGTTNDRLSPGTIGTIHGSRLRFDPARPDEGIFLVGADDFVRRVGQLSQIEPRHLIFQVPALAAGLTLRLEVRTRFTAAGEVRSGRLDAPLTSVPA